MLDTRKPGFSLFLSLAGSTVPFSASISSTAASALQFSQLRAKNTMSISPLESCKVPKAISLPFLSIWVRKDLRMPMMV